MTAAPARIASLFLAFATSALLLVAPFFVVRQLDSFAHAILPLLLFGISGAFVHGFGFVPRAAILRAAVSPAIVWPVTCGALFLLANR